MKILLAIILLSGVAGAQVQQAEVPNPNLQNNQPPPPPPPQAPPPTTAEVPPPAPQSAPVQGPQTVILQPNAVSEGAPPVAPTAAPNQPVKSVDTQILTFQNKGGGEKETKIPDLLVGVIEDYNYSPAGKRDPFSPIEKSNGTAMAGPIWPLQRYDLEQLKLVGIIWEVKIPKAMILDPSGHGYVVTVNERIGRNNGYIARIREGEIVVVENVIGSDGRSAYVTKLMKLNPQ